MIYEKTLSRKVVSISSKAIIEIEPELLFNGTSAQVDSSGFHKVRDVFMVPFRWLRVGSKKGMEKKKDLASMGKIMNLMRYVSLL